MKKSIVIIIVISLLSKMIGLLRDISLSYIYGANNVTDAYLISYTIPGFIFSIVGLGLATSFIPMYNQIKKENDIATAEGFTNNFINILIIFCLLILIVFYIFAYDFVKLIAMGFDKNTLDIAVKFTRICLAGVVFSILINIFSCYLNIKGNFHIPALLGIPNNIILIFSIVISKYTNIIVLPLGILVSLVFQTIILIIFAKKNGFIYNLKIDVRDRNIKSIFALSLPVIIGLSVNQINVMVDRTIASSIVEGGISSLNYANRIIQVIQGVFISAITTVMYPRISRLAAEKKVESFKITIVKTLKGVIIFVLPAALGAVIFSKPIIDLIYYRGCFDEEALEMTVWAFLFYSIGIIGYGFRDVLIRVFYSIHETKVPIINASIGMVINIVLNIILSKYLGIGGLALATSVAAIVTAILLFISLRKKIGLFYGANKLVYIKIITATAIMGIVGKIFYFNIMKILDVNLALILSLFVCLIIYCLSIYLLKVKEAVEFFRSIKRYLSDIKKGS